jgi:Fe-S cluster assembly scaffold protein SufB
VVEEVIMGKVLLMEKTYICDEGEELTFKLYKRTELLRLKNYVMEVIVKKGDEVIYTDTQNLSILAGKGFTMLDDTKWLLFMSEYYRRWKNEVLKEEPQT